MIRRRLAKKKQKKNKDCRNPFWNSRNKLLSLIKKEFNSDDKGFRSWFIKFKSIRPSKLVLLEYVLLKVLRVLKGFTRSCCPKECVQDGSFSGLKCKRRLCVKKTTQYVREPNKRSPGFFFFFFWGHHVLHVTHVPETFAWYSCSVSEEKVLHQSTV